MSPPGAGRTSGQQHGVRLAVAGHAQQQALAADQRRCILWPQLGAHLRVRAPRVQLAWPRADALRSASAARRRCRQAASCRRRRHPASFRKRRQPASFWRRGQPADSQQGEAAVRPAAPAARLWKSRAALPACRTPAGRLLAPAGRPHRRSARRTLPIVSAGQACRRAPPPLRRAAGRARAAPAARAPSKTRLPRSLIKVDARSRFLGGYLR